MVVMQSKRRFLALLLASAAALPAWGEDKPVVKNFKAVFEKADQIIIYSLDPSFDNKEPDESKGFHGWKILGSTTIKDAKARGKIVAAIAKGLDESDGTAAKCFNPRHGLRATVDGKPVDVVICFECLQMQFFAGEAPKTETTTRSPEKALDEVLTAAGVSLAPKKKTN
jgi:hypothetical protein